MKNEVKEGLLKFGTSNVDLGSTPDLICAYDPDEKGVRVLLISEAVHLFFVPDDNIQGMLDVCDAAGLTVRVS